MIKKLFAVMLALIGGVTIASAQKTEIRVDYMESSARYLEPVQSIMTTPLIADLTVVGGQITYTETEAFKDYVVTESLIELVPSFKKVALCRAARAHKADMIIGAMVDVITNAEGRLEITIIGYPAKYTNFRNANENDFELVKQGLAVTFSDGGEVFERPEDRTKIVEEKEVR